MTVGEAVPRLAAAVGPRALRFLFGALVAATGAVALVAASTSPARPARVIGGDQPINASGAARLALESYNSPKVVANPKDANHLAVASRMDAPTFGCALHVTFDGGGTWSETPIPGRPGATVSCFAPDVVFGADGSFYVAYTSFGPVEGQGTIPDGLWIASSLDGGRTLTTPTLALGPSRFEMRLAADPEHAGRLYLTWVEAAETSSWGFTSSGNPIRMARSDDGGLTWTSPVSVSPTTRRRVVAPTIVAGSHGRLYLAYLDVENDALDYLGAHEGKGGLPDAGPWSLVVATSSDLGETWSESVVDAGLVPVQRFLILFPPTPSLVVDPTDSSRVLVAFHDARSGDADVYLWRSDDRGRKWGAGRRIVDLPVGDGRSQYLPALSMAATGRLDAIYYDRRSDPEDVMTEVSLQSSDDGGRTFTPHVRLSSRPFDSGIGFGSERSMAELGSRLGLVSTTRGALAIWADTRAGLPETGRQDIARAVVGFPSPAPFQRPLEVGGAIAVYLGVAALAYGVAGSIGSRRQLSRLAEPK